MKACDEYKFKHAKIIEIAINNLQTIMHNTFDVLKSGANKELARQIKQREKYTTIHHLQNYPRGIKQSTKLNLNSIFYTDNWLHTSHWHTHTNSHYRIVLCKSLLTAWPVLSMAAMINDQATQRYVWNEPASGDRQWLMSFGHRLVFACSTLCTTSNISQKPSSPPPIVGGACVARNFRVFVTEVGKVRWKATHIRSIVII